MLVFFAGENKEHELDMLQAAFREIGSTYLGREGEIGREKGSRERERRRGKEEMIEGERQRGRK